MPGAQQRAGQKQRRNRGYRPRSLRPVRVFVPEWGELEALASAPGWAGPTLEEVATDARRFGWAAATAATLEVEWRRHQTKLAPNKPKALNRTIALCYAGRCPATERHSGECGPVAQRLHTARRADDLDYRRRVIDAKRRQPSTDPRAAGRLPTVGHTVPAAVNGGGLHRAGPPLRRLLPPRARPLPPRARSRRSHLRNLGRPRRVPARYLGRGAAPARASIFDTAG